MPLPLVVGVAVRVAVAAATKIVAKAAATAAAKKAAAAAAKKAAEEAAKKAAAKELGKRAGEAAARDAAKKAAQKSLESSAKAAGKAGGKGPGNTVGKHKAKKITQKPHKHCGKVSKYSKAPKKLGKRNADHVPSGAAMKAVAEKEIRKLGLEGVLSEKQIQSILNKVYNNAQTITIPEDVHKAGRTYGSKNKPLIAGDSKDLKGAFEKDAAAIQKEMDKVDHGCSEKYAEAVKELRKVDFDKYVKDTVKAHKAVRKALGLP